MGAVIAVGAWLLGSAAAPTVAVGVTAALQVGAVGGSLIYQRRQAAKAKAAANRLRKEQEVAAKAAQKKLAKLSSAQRDAYESTYSSASAGRDITEMVRHSTASRRVVYGRAKLGGIWVYPETTGASNEVLHLVLALCEGPVQAIESVWFDDEEIPLDEAGNATGKWAGSAIVRKHLGAPGDPADPILLAASTRWTAAHKLAGIAYLYVQLNVGPGLYTSVPNISAVVRGKADILDPRTGLRGYSVNPALCLYDYLTTPLVGPGIDPSDVDQVALIHAADVCDEVVVTLTGSEPRYACQGALDLSASVEDNAALFCQAMNGDLIQEGGAFAIQAGEYVTPTFRIGLDMLAGPIQFSTLQPRRQRANVVKGVFTSEQNQWQRSDFPSLSDTAAIAADGQEVVSDIALELVGSGAQAQRLASLELRQARHGRSVSLVCNLMAMPARVGANVYLDIPRYFDRAVYRVVELKFSVGNDGAPNIQLTLLENAASIYEWTTIMERLVNVPAELSASSPQVAQPIMTPDASPLPSLPVSVTITTLTPGASIRYSKTSIPEYETSGTLYNRPVPVEAGDLLFARAFRTGYLASPPALETYA